MEASDARRIERIAQGLGRISPSLEGLLRRGLELLGAIDQPGNAILVAHVGREIVLGVIAELGDEAIALTPEEAADLTVKKEDYRRNIASALRLRIDHPLVKEWFDLYKTLVGHAHFPRRNEARSPDAAATTFRMLLEYLYAQLALYFDAQEELLDLLNRPTPSPEDLQRLRPLLARPALRRFFFGQLNHAGWLGPLTDGGLLSRPLSQQGDLDTVRWSNYAWPEGGYLVRMTKSGADPETVLRALEHIPLETTNPMVWGSAAEAALHLPPALAARLVGRLTGALNGPIPFLFPDALLRLAVRLADSGERRAAFRLGDALLSVRPRQDPTSLAEDETWYRQEAVFRYFRSHELEGIFNRLIPALAELDALKALKLLTRIAGLAARAAGASEAGSQDESTHWEVDPKEGEQAFSMKEGLGPSITRLALQVAGKSEDDAREVLRLLDQDVVVLRRIGLFVLAEQGPVDQARLDRVVADEGLFADYKYREEYRRLLQRQFRNASAEARAIHIQRIREELPRENFVEHLRFFGNANPTEEDVGGAIARREVELIERLGEPVPEELRDVLTSNRTFLEGLRERQRKVQQEPVQKTTSQQPFQRASPEELVELLHAWTRPPTALEEAVQAITGVLEERVREYPHTHGILASVRWTELPPSWVSAVLRGFATALEHREELPWEAVLDLADWLVVAQPSDFGDEKEIETGLLEETKVTILKLIADAAKSNRLPNEDVSRALGVVHAAQDSFAENPSRRTGRSDEPTAYPEGFAADYLTGQGVRAAVELALLSIRRRAAGVDGMPSPEAALPILDAALHSGGKPAVAARIMVAKRLPWILLLNPEWVRTTTPSLFPDGFVPGKEDPAWRAYVRNSVYDSALMALRPVYSAAVRQIAEGSFHDGKARETATERLASHIIWAYIRGGVSVGEDGRFLETIFETVPVDALGHVYWSIFREFTDAGEKAASTLVERVIALWDWRLGELARRPMDERDREEATSLGWLFQLRQLPPERALELLRRTLAVSAGTGTHPWNRLAEIATADPAAALECAERLIHATIASDYPHLNDDEVSAVLRAALAVQTTREQAVRLIHELGEAGFEQFRSLLDEDYT